MSHLRPPPAPAPAPCARARSAPVLLCSCAPVLLCSRAPFLVVPPSITYTDIFLATDISGMVDGLVVALVVSSPNGSGFESHFRQVQIFFSELVNNKKNRPLYGSSRVKAYKGIKLRC